MAWDVEFTSDFEAWWNGLTEAEQESVAYSVTLLEQYGPTLKFPHSTKIVNARNDIRELRVQHQGNPYRVLYAFDPRRSALLLVGGDKTGNDRWYEIHVPKADALFEAHLAEMKNERRR